MSLGIEHRQTFPLALPQRQGAPGRRNNELDGQGRLGSPDSDIEYLYTNAPPPRLHLNTSSQRPRAPHHRPTDSTDVIHIVDSDEDDNQAGSSSHSARRRSSPPPRRATPLPRYNIHLHQDLSLSPPASGSTSTAGPSRPRNGLGGGLLSLPRAPSNLHSDDNQTLRLRREAERARRQRQVHRRNVLSRAIDHVFGGGNPAALFEGYPSFQQVLGAAMWFPDPPTFNGTNEPRILPPINPPTPQQAYSPKMTHRSAVPPTGFTFDFDAEGGADHAPIEVDYVQEAPPSSKQASTHPKVLICARCSEPLLLGPKRVWALRCGHMICGSCVDKLSLPVLGKGKAKQEESDFHQVPSTAGYDGMALFEDTEGTEDKGKAKEESDQLSVSESIESQTITEPSQRPRRVAQLVVPSDRRLRSQSGRTASQSQASNQQNCASKPTRGKRKARSLITPAGTTSEEQEYHCPVEGCWRSHWSANTWVPASTGPTFDEDGQERGEWIWKQKNGTGAIPIFV